VELEPVTPSGAPKSTLCAGGPLFGLTAGTIRDRFEDGDFPGFRLFPKTDRRGRPTGPVRFRLSEILDQLDAWRVNGPGLAEEVAPVPNQSPDPGRSLTVAPVPIVGGGSDAS
jgi:hypothetical protein